MDIKKDETQTSVEEEKSNHETISDKIEVKQATEDELLLKEDEVIEEIERVCPFKARVVEDYTPSPYETSHIALKKGQIVNVIEMTSAGKWYGELTDGKKEKKGLFPFNRVEAIN